MKTILFLGLLALIVSGSEAVRCEDIQTCVGNLNIQERDIAKLCGSLRSLINCMQSAMQDCRDSGLISQSVVDNSEREKDAYNAIMNERCGDYGNGSGVLKTSAVAAVASFFAFILLVSLS